jgi:signal recognition particle GTPase
MGPKGGAAISIAHITGKLILFLGTGKKAKYPSASFSITTKI